MGWGEVLKELLKSFAQLIRDIPIWAKVVLAFGIFCLLAFAVIANLRQLIVYDVEIIEKSATAGAGWYNVWHENTQRESRSDEGGRVKLLLRTGPLERQENLVVIKRPVLNVGDEPRRVRYGFVSRKWQSDVVSFTLTCNFERRACERERVGQFEEIKEVPAKTGERHELGVGRAYAQAPKRPAVSVPSLRTYRQVAPREGYTYIRFTNLTLAPHYCKAVAPCPDALFAEFWWNGVRILFDGTEPAASDEWTVAVTEGGNVRGGWVFALENTLFGPGSNTAEVKVYSRGGLRTLQWSVKQMEVPARPIDTLVALVQLLRPTAIPVKGQRGVFTATVETRTVMEEMGRSHEIILGVGTQEEVSRKRAFVNAAGWLIEGQAVLGIVRPPTPGDDRWKLALGLQELAVGRVGRVGTLFSQREAERAYVQIRRLSPAQVGPLNREEFVVQRFRALQ